MAKKRKKLVVRNGKKAVGRIALLLLGLLLLAGIAVAIVFTIKGCGVMVSSRAMPFDSASRHCGAGDGKLSAFVGGDWLKKFDAYMARPNENYLSAEELTPASFDFVITCSVFEHLIGAADVEKIFALLKSNGTMALHTLICEEVPRDPNWFYLQPVHCTFWTNAAMKKIFTQYDFKACAYHVEARLWFMFRDAEKISLPKDFIAANDFVDYWKVKPYR